MWYNSRCRVLFDRMKRKLVCTSSASSGVSLKSRCFRRTFGPPTLAAIVGKSWRPYPAVRDGISSSKGWARPCGSRAGKTNTSG